MQACKSPNLSMMGFLRSKFEGRISFENASKNMILMFSVFIAQLTGTHEMQVDKMAQLYTAVYGSAKHGLDWGEWPNTSDVEPSGANPQRE